jgi:hypothetical protein
MPTPILYVNQFNSGLYTQRSPLVTPTSSQGVNTVVLTDVLSSGANIELSNRNTLIRRPGTTKFCSQQFASNEYPLGFYSFRNLAGTRKLLVDTPVKVNTFTSSAITSLYTKGTTAPTRFQSVANACYMCDGTNAKKWDGTTVSNWGIATPATNVTIANLGSGALSPTVGYQYVYTYHNSTTGHESTASPISATTGAQTSKNFKITGTLSTDPQVDGINIYRTLDGGSVFYYLTTVPNTTGFSVTGYTDSTPDSGLNNEITAPVNHANDPPPAGISNVVFHMGRLWGAAGHYVYFAGGPDTLVGVPEEAWPPGYVFSFPGAVTAMVSTSAGLLVFTTNDSFIIRGSDSGSFYAQTWQKNFGVFSQNCVASDGDLIYLYTANRQLFMIADTLEEVGFPIGDVLLNGFDPTLVYLALFRNGSDAGLFISDGSTYTFKYSIAKNSWSPLAAVVGGAKAIASLTTADGVNRLMIGRAAGSGYILYRDITNWTDDGSTYSAWMNIGTLILGALGATVPIDAILLDRIAAGTDPTVGVLLNEISGTFTTLPNPVADPPLLPPSTTIVSKRHYLKAAATPLAQQVRHLQISITFANENAQSELLGFALLKA